MTTYTYDGTTRQITGASLPPGLSTTYTYDGNHRLQRVVDQPIARTNSYSWNSDGTVHSHTDERGLTVTNFWDGLHRLTGVRYPDGTTSSNRYDLVNGTPYPNSSGGTGILDLTASKDRLGYWSYFAYDAIRRRVFDTNANAVVTAYGYCDCGSISSMTNALGTPVQQATIYNRDYQGNLTSTYNADGYNVTNFYDSLARRTATGDAWGYRWFNHNNLSLLTSVSNACGLEQLTTYDLLDRPVYATDANGVTITNAYDDLDRLLTRGYPDGGVERFGYSVRGLVAYTNQIGLSKFFAYDSATRKTFETNANGEVIRYTNNAAGDLLSLTDGKNHTTRWNYDEYGRVTNKLDQAGAEILRYKYDPENRLTNRWSAAKGNTYYTYDAIGNLTFVNYPISPDVTFQYDWLNRLTNMVDAVGTNRYTYTAAGQLLTEDGPFASDTVTNTYLNRLRVGLSLAQPTGAWTNGFTYDAARRLTNVTAQAGSFANVYATGVGGSSGFSSRFIQRQLLANGSAITNYYDGVARLLATHLRTSAGVLTNKHEYLYNLAGQRTNETRMDGSTVACV
jgi:YD repeat-containing protein